MTLPLRISTTGLTPSPAPASARTTASSSAFYTSTPTTSGVPFRKEDFSFLSQLFDILQAVEKPGEGLSEVGRLISKFNEGIESCVRILEDLPGADLSREDQEKLLRSEQETLEKKRAQLAKYRQLPVFTKLNARLGRDANLDKDMDMSD